MSHTKGKVTVTGSSVEVVKVPRLIARCENTFRDDAECEANAERIKYCWNNFEELEAEAKELRDGLVQIANDIEDEIKRRPRLKHFGKKGVLNRIICLLAGTFRKERTNPLQAENKALREALEAARVYLNQPQYSPHGNTEIIELISEVLKGDK